MEAISDFYAELRENNEHLKLPITVRTLESIIRLSTAAAKARMSEEGVEEVNCSILHGFDVWCHFCSEGLAGCQSLHVICLAAGHSEQALLHNAVEG